MILAAFERHTFIPVISYASLYELRDVLSRPRIQRRLQRSVDDIDDLLHQVRLQATIAMPTGELHLCRDPDDDIMLETAILGEARYLVTRDADIARDLDLITHLRENGIEVVTVAQFLRVLGEG